MHAGSSELELIVMHCNVPTKKSCVCITSKGIIYFYQNCLSIKYCVGVREGVQIHIGSIGCSTKAASLATEKRGHGLQGSVHDVVREESVKHA